MQNEIWQTASEGIYMLNKSGLHNMTPSANEVLENLNSKIVQAFNGYSLSQKGKDIVWSAIREKKATLKSNYQWTIIGDPWVHYLVVDCEGWMVENFQVQSPVSEILGDKVETDEEVQRLCAVLMSMGVQIWRESA